MKRCVIAICVLALGLWCSLNAPLTVEAQGSLGWPQWAQSPQHAGFLKVAGQNLNRNLVNIVYDPLVPQEMAGTGGDLLVHYQTPLVDGNDVFMESKGGTYTTTSYATQTWHQNKFTWQGSTLAKVWTFDSDWVAPGSQNNFWEPVYHAVLANGFLYDPGAGGTIFKINRTDGSVVSRINPFDAIDANTFTASPLSTDAGGNIYYNVVRITGDSPSFYSHDVVNSWLIKVGPDDSVAKTDYKGLLRQATIIGDAVPDATDDCKVQFPSSQLPWPPSPNAVPSTTKCGAQRAALNVAPAIAPDGTIYTVSRGHFVTRYNYLIAVNPDLTGKWASSLRGHLNDGCNDGTVTGSILPVNGQPGGCRVGSHNGVDPGTNEPGPGRVLDDASSTPTVAPDGTILFGAYTRYNYAQGHLMQFSASGAFLNAFNFGWDSTPAIYPNGGSYSIVIKNNHYSGLGSYCNNAAACPTDRTATNTASPEAFFVTQLAPVVDANGVVYANSEDGFLYAINQGGTKKQSIFQQLNLGAAYTPASLGSDGKIYSQNAGHMFVVGQ